MKHVVDCLSGHSLRPLTDAEVAADSAADAASRAHLSHREANWEYFVYRDRFHPDSAKPYFARNRDLDLESQRLFDAAVALQRRASDIEHQANSAHKADGAKASSSLLSNSDDLRSVSTIEAGDSDDVRIENQRSSLSFRRTPMTHPDVDSHGRLLTPEEKLRQVAASVEAVFDHLDRTGALDSEVTAELAYRLRRDVASFDPSPMGQDSARVWQDKLDELEVEQKRSLLDAAKAEEIEEPEDLSLFAVIDGHEFAYVGREYREIYPWEPPGCISDESPFNYRHVETGTVFDIRDLTSAQALPPLGLEVLEGVGSGDRKAHRTLVKAYLQAVGREADFNFDPVVERARQQQGQG